MSSSLPLLMLVESREWTLREVIWQRSCSMSLSLLSNAICSSRRTWFSSAISWVSDIKTGFKPQFINTFCTQRQELNILNLIATKSQRSCNLDIVSGTEQCDENIIVTQNKILRLALLNDNFSLKSGLFAIPHRCFFMFSEIWLNT